MGGDSTVASPSRISDLMALQTCGNRFWPPTRLFNSPERTSMCGRPRCVASTKRSRRASRKSSVVILAADCGSAFARTTPCSIAAPGISLVTTGFTWSWPLTGAQAVASEVGRGTFKGNCSPRPVGRSAGRARRMMGSAGRLPLLARNSTSPEVACSSSRQRTSPLGSSSWRLTPRDSRRARMPKKSSDWRRPIRCSILRSPAWRPIAPTLGAVPGRE
jgi:hypothetical protein